MKRTEVFYYLYIPDDGRACQWNWFLDEQLSLIKKSRLHDVAKINLLISGPLHWSSLQNCFPFVKNGNKGTEENKIRFYEKIQEYVNWKFPFVHSFIFRDISEPNLFEGFPLSFIYEKCKTEDLNILYTHSKGITRTQPSIFSWREVLNDKLILEWKRCISFLEENDLVAMQDGAMSDKIVSGNFFWSKSSYIRTLCHPLDITQYTHENLLEEIKNYPSSVRYSYELWIRSNQPKIAWTNNTKIDHFDSYYFLENKDDV